MKSVDRNSVKITNQWLIAANKGAVDEASSFLEAGMDVNATNMEGMTALIRSAFHGNVELVRLLLDAGATIDAKDINGNNALWYAANKGHLEVVGRLLDLVAPEQRNRFAGRALYEAARKGHLDIVRLLIERGVDPNVSEQNGYTPLMVGSKRFSVVQALVEAGADVNQTGADGATALIKACYRAKTATIEHLIHSGALVNASGADGESALSIAARRGRKQVCELLVEHGAAIDVKNAEGCTPLMIALQNDQLETARALVEMGADVTVNDRTGRTVLIEAARCGDIALVQTCISKGADVNGRTNDGDTALLLECFDGEDRTVESLLSGGADVNVQNRSGRTPLIAAVQGGDAKRIEQLLKAGADVSLCDGAGKRAADYAGIDWITEKLAATPGVERTESTMTEEIDEGLKRQLLEILEGLEPGQAVEIFELAHHLGVEKPELLELCAVSLESQGVRLIGEPGVGRPLVTLIPGEPKSGATGREETSPKEEKSLIADAGIGLASTVRETEHRASEAGDRIAVATSAVGRVDPPTADAVKSPSTLESVTLNQLLKALAKMVENEPRLQEKDKWPLVEKIEAVANNELIGRWLTTPLGELID